MKVKVTKIPKRKITHLIRHQLFKSEGNKGGDFIEMRNLFDGRIALRVGHCCVMSIEKVVPVEFLTAVITDTLLKNNMDVLKVIDNFHWSKEFNEELKSKVRSTNFMLER